MAEIYGHVRLSPDRVVWVNHHIPENHDPLDTSNARFFAVFDTGLPPGGGRPPTWESCSLQGIQTGDFAALEFIVQRAYQLGVFDGQQKAADNLREVLTRG